MAVDSIGAYLPFNLKSLLVESRLSVSLAFKVTWRGMLACFGGFEGSLGSRLVSLGFDIELGEARHVGGVGCGREYMERALFRFFAFLKLVFGALPVTDYGYFHG